MIVVAIATSSLAITMNGDVLAPAPFTFIKPFQATKLLMGYTWRYDFELDIIKFGRVMSFL